MGYESRPIVRMNYRRGFTVRKVIPDEMLDHRLSLLVFYGPGCKPSSINIDDCKKRSMPLLGGLQRAHKIETNLFSGTSNEVVPVGVTLRSIPCQSLATRTLKYVFSARTDKSREDVFKLHTVSQGITIGMVLTMERSEYPIPEFLGQCNLEILFIGERNGFPNKETRRGQFEVLKTINIKLLIGSKDEGLCCCLTQRATLDKVGLEHCCSTIVSLSGPCGTGNSICAEI